MNDLISRQALCEYALNQKEKSVTANDIMRFSSAHPAADDDLVSREAVKKWLERWNGYIDMDIIRRLQYRVIDIPSTQPERKTGHWKLLNNGDAICSECGRRQKDVWDFDNWDNFCRHCGADMRGDTE